MKSIHRTANLCKFRTEWHQYIPTEPLSTYYRPVVERPFERVWEPRGVETPIVESVENWPMSRSSGWRDALGMGEVIDVQVIEVRSQVAEEAPLEFPDERKILQMVYEKTTIINIKVITKQLETQKNQFVQIETSFTEKTTKKGMDLAMVQTLREFFVENLFFIPRSNDYYVFDENTCLWKHLDLEELTYFCLVKFEDRNWSFTTIQQGIKSASAVTVTDLSTVRDMFYNTHLIPFQNGCWDLKKNKFEYGLKKDNYLCSTLPFEYKPFLSTDINAIAPNICKWLSERVEGSEILTNVLSAVMFACILQIQHPERFLFLTGHSATGKSTFFLLLTKLISENAVYTISAEDFSCDFGLEDLAEGPRKSVVIFHDIGCTVTQGFINTLRTLVSSEGETVHKRVRRKHKRTGFLRFSGMICAASNMSPFTGVQAQGIVDRRLLLVPFLKRVEPKETKNFDTLFPANEIQNIVTLATQVSPQQIRNFLLGVRTHPDIQQIILEHYADSDDQSTLLQRFVCEKIEYTPGAFISYGLRKKISGSLYYEFEKWKSRQDPDIFGKEFYRPIQLKQTLLTYIHMNYPEWKNVEDRRKLVNGNKVLGITNISITNLPKPAVTTHHNGESSFDLKKYQNSPWWIQTSMETSTG